MANQYEDEWKRKQQTIPPAGLYPGFPGIPRPFPQAASDGSKQSVKPQAAVYPFPYAAGVAAGDVKMAGAGNTFQPAANVGGAGGRYAADGAGPVTQGTGFPQGMKEQGAGSAMLAGSGPSGLAQFGSLGLKAIYETALEFTDPKNAGRFLQIFKNSNMPPADFLEIYRDVTLAEQMPQAGPVNKTEAVSTVGNGMGKSVSPLSKLYTGLQDGTIWESLKNSPLGQAAVKAAEPVQESMQASAELAQFLKKNESSSSARVQAILDGIRKKVNGNRLTAQEIRDLTASADSRVQDNSMLQLIGKSIWYNDVRYDLQDPRNQQGGMSIGPAYKTIVDEGDSQWSFDWKSALGGMQLEGEDQDLTMPYTKGQRDMIGVMNLAPMILNNLDVDDVQLTLEKVPGSDTGHAYLKVGSKDMRNTMQAFAGTTQYMVGNASYNGAFARALALNKVEALYEQATGIRTSKWMDLQMTFDPKHKDDPYYGYIVAEEDGSLICVSPVYPGDKLQIVTYWRKNPLCDLTYMIDPVQMRPGGLEDMKISLANIAKKVKDKQGGTSAP